MSRWHAHCQLTRRSRTGTSHLQINFENRFVNNPEPRLSCWVDGTEFEINKPSVGDYLNPETGYRQNVFYSVKKKQHAVNYCICVHKHSYEILFIAGPATGSTHDKTMAVQALVPHLLPGELVGGDPAYRGDPHFLAKVPAMDPLAHVFNPLLAKRRMHIERVFGTLKGRFRILQDRYTRDLGRHQQIVINCVILHNIRLYKHLFRE
jgi:hypothetical protein